MNNEANKMRAKGYRYRIEFSSDALPLYAKTLKQASRLLREDFSDSAHYPVSIQRIAPEVSEPYLLDQWQVNA